MKTCELVRVLDVAPINEKGASGSFEFRIEVLRDLSSKRSFFARVYRRESLRVQATFPMVKGRSRGFLADHEVLVADDMIGAESFRAPSAAGVVRKVRWRIAEVFKRTPSRRARR
jgi:hypothetical protein